MKTDYITAIYDISTGCNYRCVYCRNDWEKPGNSPQPPFEAVKKVIDTFCLQDFKKIILTGGEFFTIPYWKEVLTYIKDKGLTAWLITNAALVEPGDIPFLENHLERISVSFHAADKKMYCRIMGVKADGIFAKVVENLRLLGNSRIQTGIFYSPLRINYRSFYDTVAFLKAAGVKLSYVNLNRIIPTQHTLTFLQEEKPLGYFEHKALIEQLLRIKQEFGIEAHAEAYPVCYLNTFIPDINLVKEINRPCFLGRKALAFNTDGSKKLCPATGYTLEEKEENVLSEFNKAEWRNPVCRECPHWGICLGGCHASKGEIYSDDTLIIDDQIEFKEGIDTLFFDLLARLYKPFLSAAYKKAKYRYTVFSQKKYPHPVGIIAVRQTSATAHFVEIALVPDLKEKYYTFLIMNKLFQTLPLEKYGWTIHKANYPSLILLERLGGGFHENTVKNKKRIEAEGFFKTRQPAPKKMLAALQQLKPEAQEKFREWLKEFTARHKEKQVLQEYLKEYRP